MRKLLGTDGHPGQVRIQRMPALLPEDVSLCLYRVAQESLRNIAKHAGGDERQGCSFGEERTASDFVSKTPATDLI